MKTHTHFLLIPLLFISLIISLTLFLYPNTSNANEIEEEHLAALTFQLDFLKELFNQLKESFFSVAQAQAPTSGLISHWKFNDGTGSLIAADSVGTNTGTLVGGPTWTTGKVGGALDFDGVNDYVDTGANPALPSGASARTITFWFAADAWGTDLDRVIVSYARSSQAGTGMEVYAEDNGVSLNWTGHRTIIQKNNLVTGQWYHYAVVVPNGATVTGDAVYYLDGVAYAASDESNLSIPLDTDGNDTHIVMGSRSDRWDDHFDGRIDEVRIYNRALSAQEVLDLYNSGITPDTTPPLIPTNFSATAISQSQIDLTWTASTDAESGVSNYIIYRDGVNVATSPANSYSDTGLTAGTNYSYEVSAVNGAGLESGKSNTVSETALAPDTTPPTISITSPATGSTVSGTITVSASASDPSSPSGQVTSGLTEVDFQLDGVILGSVAGVEDTPSPYSISWNTNLTANGSHTLTAVARDAAGNQTTAAGVTVTVNNIVDTEAPSVPTSLSATVISSSQINLSWNASTDNVGVTGYNIYRDGVKVDISPTNSYPDTGLQASKTYLYKVSAFDAAGNESSQSTLVSAATLAASAGNTYYVDRNHPQASDSNPGTEALPWKTIQKAEPILVAGDTVLVKEGTYEVSPATSDCKWSRPGISPANSGTAAMPIAIRVFPGHEVVLDNKINPDGSDSSCPTIGSRESDYVIIDGFTIRNPGTKGVAVFGTSSKRVKGVVIENMIISGVRSDGCGNAEAIRVEHATETIIRNNLIFDAHSTPPGCDGVGVRKYRTDHTLMEHNEIYDVGDGLYDKVNGLANVYRYNYVHDCIRVGIRIRAGGSSGHQDDEVYGNIVARCRTGITSSGTVAGSSQDQNVNTIIYGNTVVDSNKGMSVQTDITNNQVWNNIIYASGARGIEDDNPSLGYCDYNLYFDSPSATCGANSLTSDPQFVNTAFLTPDDFKLQAASPAIGAGRFGDNIGAYAIGNEIIGLTGGTTPPPPPPSPLPSDTTLPSIPTNLSATPISSSQIDLSWSQSTDNVGVTGYRIYRGGVLVTTVTATSYSDTGLSANTIYSYTVSAIDAAGNESSQSTSASATTQAPAPGINVRITSGADDAEECLSTGAVGLTSTDLEFISATDNCSTGDQVVGMRFQNITIPQGSTITNAYVEFKVDELDSIATSLIIQAQDSDNAGTFTTATNNISSRFRTTAQVSWSPASWSTVGALKQTPDISNVIQEVINLPNWLSGNGLAVIITGSGVRTAESFNGDSAGAPLLHVEFTTQAALVGDLNNDGTVNSLDWSIMKSVWFTSSPTADINNDGIVNTIDFSLLNQNWGK